MIACSKPYPRLEWLLNSFADWRQHRRELNEMRQLDEVEFGRIASDLKVSPDDLDELVRRGPRAADELARLLKVLGIDECLLARTELPILRDLERVCAMCRYKRQCDHDLAAGTIAAHYREYCLNAPTIEELKQSA
jgi:hypothetical protein